MTRSITAQELKKRADSEGAVILDVRAVDAYSDWRIQDDGVTSFNIQNSKLKERGVASFAELPKDKEIITVCAKGVAAQETAQMLEAAGYHAVFLEGGMAAWSEFYNPVTVVRDEAISIYQMIRPAKGCLSYILTSGSDAIVVDPGRHIDNYVDFAKQQGVTIRHVFDTHLHADHISGGWTLAKATDAQYWIAPEEAEGATFEYHALEDGMTLPFGTTDVKVISRRTPGHTIASTSFLVGDKYVLSGDTLFVSGLGRSDLKGHAREMAEMMFHTVRTTLASFPDELTVLPAHFSDYTEKNASGYVGETMGKIRENNRMLHITDKDQFVELSVKNSGVTPPNPETIIAINRGQISPSKEQQTELETGPNRCAVK